MLHPGNPHKEGSIIRPTLEGKKLKRRKFQQCGQSWTAVRELQTSVCKLTDASISNGATNVMLKSAGESEGLCIFFGTSTGTGVGVAREST